MDCDDAMLAIANRERTLTGREEANFREHLETCETCRTLADERAVEWRWITRMPETSLDADDALVLPEVDPVVYDVDLELAAGGMGRILKATDRRLGREVAIKEVLDPTLRARFEREAQITARLQHPAIVPIYEAGRWPDGTPFYTMRLVWGANLAHAIAGTKTFADRLALLPHVLAVTDALAYAHSQRIVHRDLKPGNILVGEFGETVVIDWGLAKDLEHDPPTETVHRESPETPIGLTTVGSVMGTPGFMAPEQASGQPIDERADVYALGAILYNVLAGSVPYADTHGRGTAAQVIEVSLLRPPTSIDLLAPEIPADLRAIVECAMARTLDERYPSAKEMAQELRQFLAGKLVASHTYSLGELLMRWLRNHRVAVGVGALALVAIVIVTALAFRNVGHARDDARAALTSEQASAAALLEEHGRSELLAGDPKRALVYLSAALQRGRDNVELRHLLAVAVRGLDTERFEVNVEAEAIGVQSDGTLVVVAAHALATWRGGAKINGVPFARAVEFAAIDRAAKRIAVLDRTTVAVWDADGTAPRWSIEDPAFEHAAFVWSGDGARLAIIGGPLERQRLQVRDATTGTVLLDPGSSADVLVAAFDPTGVRVAALDDTGTVRVWNLADGTVHAQLASADHSRAIAMIDADRIVLGGTKVAELWSLDGDPHVVATLGGHRAQVTAIAISDDREMIATGDDSGALRVWSADGALRGEAIALGGQSVRIAFAVRTSGSQRGDRTLITSSVSSGRVEIWDASLALDSLHVIDVRAGGVRALAASGTTLVTAGLEGPARVWTLPHAERRIARVPGRDVVVGGDVWIYRAATSTVIRRFDSGAVVRELGRLDAADADMLANRDASRVALVPIDRGRAIVVDTATDQRMEIAVTGVASQSGDARFLADRDDRHVRVVAIDTGEVTFDHTSATAPSASELSPTGDRIVLAFANEVAVFRVATGEPLGTFSIGSSRPDPRFELAFDPTGRRIVVYDADAATILDLASGARIEIANGFDIGSVAFDARGTRVLVRRTNKLRLWDTRTGVAIGTVEEPHGGFTLAPDGERIATGAADGVVSIWSASGALLERIHTHAEPITSVAFSADGTRLVVEGRDHTIVLLDVGLDRTPAAEIARLADRGPWRLVDGHLAPR
jgi:eukaryotic-like serine/threonine-protein kinase